MAVRHPFYFSVIVPTYNRPHLLKGCLRALSKQSYPLNLFEVIVVDDGSHSDLMAALSPFKSKMHVSLVKQKNEGPAAARNHGAKKALGEILVFTDDDCRPKKDWLKILKKKFELENCAMLGGRTINRLTNNAYSIASQHIVSFAYEYYNIDSRDAHFFASNNMAVRREVFFSCGEFDPTFRTSEDRELCNRFVLIGLKLNYAPEAVVYHIHNLSFSKFCKQHFNYGRGAYCYHLNRANKEDAINVIGHLRFFINSGKSCFTEQQAYCLTMRAKIVSLFFVWQLANLFGFLFQKFCNSKNDSENP